MFDIFRSCKWLPDNFLGCQGALGSHSRGVWFEATRGASQTRDPQKMCKDCKRHSGFPQTRRELLKAGLCPLLKKPRTIQRHKPVEIML